MVLRLSGAFARTGMSSGGGVSMGGRTGLGEDGIFVDGREHQDRETSRDSGEHSASSNQEDRRG